MKSLISNAVFPRADGRILTPASPEFGSHGLLLLNDTASVVGQWNVANDPFAIPFTLPHGGVVKQLGWLNGSSAGGQHDIGVYDTAFNRLVSAGSTTGTGNNAWQWVNVTDTALKPGRYYLAIVRDNTTVSRVVYYVTQQNDYVVQFCGGLSSTTDAVPLPNPLTNMVASALTLVPVMAIAMGRDPF